jgi:hypothetical protein
MKNLQLHLTLEHFPQQPLQHLLQTLELQEQD